MNILYSVPAVYEILTDFKNASPIIPRFLGHVMKNLSVIR